MKANELMIGDWVIVRARIDRTAKIETIDLHSVKTSIGGPWIFDEIGPIPLTPEILEKNGWEYNHIIESYQLKDNAFYISIDLEEKTRIYVMNDYIFGMALGFVHELQHAMHLCGIEKEIEL